MTSATHATHGGNVYMQALSEQPGEGVVEEAPVSCKGFNQDSHELSFIRDTTILYSRHRNNSEAATQWPTVTPCPGQQMVSGNRKTFLQALL
jgi:hypothetical protein